MKYIFDKEILNQLEEIRKERGESKVEFYSRAFKFNHEYRVLKQGQVTEKIKEAIEEEYGIILKPAK